MWCPKTAAELTEAIANGTMPHEAAGFEVKKQPPDKAKNSDMAVDVAAMSTDGGVIIYGVDEDRAAVTFSAGPFPLAGFKERISQVVDTHVRESIEFAVYELQLDRDPTQGFAAVVVPTSLRAPHMVETTGQYYGRQPGGNRVLGEADVARLYERRQRAEGAAQRALGDAIDVAIGPLLAGASFGALHVVVVPLVSSDTGFRERAMQGVPFPELASDVTAAFNALRWKSPSAPQFMDIVSGAVPQSTVEGTALMVAPADSDAYVRATRLELLDNGTVRYFQNGLVIKEKKAGPVIRDNALAHLVAHTCLLAGNVLERGGYRGAVEVLTAVTGAYGAVSAEWTVGRFHHSPVAGKPKVPISDYRNHVRVPASKLRDEPIEVARSLVSKLLRTIRPQGFPDPFQPV